MIGYIMTAAYPIPYTVRYCNPYRITYEVQPEMREYRISFANIRHGRHLFVFATTATATTNRIHTPVTAYMR